MADWDIQKPLGLCSGSGDEIEVGQEYFAALVDGPEGLERRDFSATYWDDQKPEVYCFWKARLPEPNQKKKLFVNDEMLMSFFERLTDETEPERLNFRFVLAMILMRKRKLKYDATEIKDEQEYWRLRVTGQKRFVEVLNPHLDEAQMEQFNGSNRRDPA